MNNLKLLSLLSIFLLFSACFVEDEEDLDFDDTEESVFDGTKESLEDFYNPELVMTLENFGFQINEGDNPPFIEGGFHMYPFILYASNIDNDQIGTLFPDNYITFSNQDNSSLSIDLVSNGGSQVDTGFGSLIGGAGNSFSVYF